MNKKGLNKALIFEAGENLLKEKGYGNFSLREIAGILNVKPASLYNHIEGYDEIIKEITLKASNKMGKALKEATFGNEKEQAFLKGAIAYREFALKNPELYKAFVRTPELKDEELMKAGFESFVPLKDVILSFGLSKTDALHFIRALRSVMHGFIELSNNGYMQRGNASRDESYEVIISNFLNVLKSIASNKGGANN